MQKRLKTPRLQNRFSLTKIKGMKEINYDPLVNFNYAVELMIAGQPVIFPTETFFGLGSRALDAEAVASVFKTKRRTTSRPLPLILGEWEQLDMVAKTSESILPLLQKVWPGPLSVIFPARLRVPDILTGGTGGVAVRLSSHPVARDLAKAVGEPITASSANISGVPAVTSVKELDPELVAAVSGVLDMPPTPAGGLPSTLVEYLGNTQVRILREGPITKQKLLEVGFDC